MSLTEKWERFKAEQKDPGLVDKDTKVVDYACVDKSAPMHTVQIAVNDIQPGLLIVKRIDQLNQVVESTTSQMTVDKIVYEAKTLVEKPTFAPLWAGTSLDVLKLVFDRVEQHTRVINQMTEQMERDGIEYSVRRHLMQARHAEAYAIFKLLGQDNADQNT